MFVLAIKEPKKPGLDHNPNLAKLSLTIFLMPDQSGNAARMALT